MPAAAAQETARHEVRLGDTWDALAALGAV